MLPSLFVAHGTPLLAIENNEYTQFLNQLMVRNILFRYFMPWMQTIRSVQSYYIEVFGMAILVTVFGNLEYCNKLKIFITKWRIKNDK